MNCRGLTITEGVIAVSIVSILIATMGLSYQDWREKYEVESVTKELFADLMQARLMAIQKNMEHYVVLNGDSYAVVEDTDDNGKASSGDKTLPTFPKKVPRILSRNGSGNKIYFSKRGMISSLRTVWFTSDSAPDYDCIKVSMTRIIMGKTRQPDQKDSEIVCDAK